MPRTSPIFRTVPGLAIQRACSRLSHPPKPAEIEEITRQFRPEFEKIGESFQRPLRLSDEEVVDSLATALPKIEELYPYLTSCTPANAIRQIEGLIFEQIFSHYSFPRWHDDPADRAVDIHVRQSRVIDFLGRSSDLWDDFGRRFPHLTRVNVWDFGTELLTIAFYPWMSSWRTCPDVLGDPARFLTHSKEVIRCEVLKHFKRLDKLVSGPLPPEPPPTDDSGENHSPSDHELLKALAEIRNMRRSLPRLKKALLLFFWFKRVEMKKLITWLSKKFPPGKYYPEKIKDFCLDLEEEFSAFNLPDTAMGALAAGRPSWLPEARRKRIASRIDSSQAQELHKLIWRLAWIEGHSLATICKVCQDEGHATTNDQVRQIKNRIHLNSALTDADRQWISDSLERGN